MQMISWELLIFPHFRQLTEKKLAALTHFQMKTCLSEKYKLAVAMAQMWKTLSSTAHFFSGSGFREMARQEFATKRTLIKRSIFIV